MIGHIYRVEKMVNKVGNMDVFFIFLFYGFGSN